MSVARKTATISLMVTAAGCGSDFMAPEADRPLLNVSTAGTAACEGFQLTAPTTTLAVGQELQLTMVAPGAQIPVPQAINPIAPLGGGSPLGSSAIQPRAVLPASNGASSKQQAEVAATSAPTSRSGAVQVTTLRANANGTRGSLPSTSPTRPAGVRIMEWRSTNTAAATVNANGLVRGVGDGVTTIIVRCQRGADSLDLRIGRGTVAPEPTPTPTPPPPAPEPTPVPPGAIVATRAELPRTVLARPTPAVTRTVRVPAGGDLQQALNSAEPGDELVLDAGATYRGSFVLPSKAGSGWITLRSSGAGQLAAGRRVRPSDSTAMARLVSGHWTEPALRTASGAARWRLIGLNVAVDQNATAGYSLMALGSAQVGEQLTVASIPTDLVLERMFIHGHANANFQRCVALNSARTIIVDSYINECHGQGTDAQAIGGWNGPGPYLIQNNYLEGATQNIMFGGSDPSIANLSPSDIEIRGNHFFTPRAWGSRYPTKAQLELKHSVRVLIEGNVFDYDGGTIAYSQLWKSVNQSGTAPWSVVKDVTFRYNIVRNALGGLNFADHPEPNPAIRAHRFTVEHNLFENISGRNVMLAGIDDLILANNTWASGGTHGILLYGSTMRNFSFIRNVFPEVPFAFGSADGAGFGQQALEYHTTAPRSATENAFVNTVLRTVPNGSVSITSTANPPAGYGADRTLVANRTAGVVQP